VAIV
jgi:N-acetylmuramoyl-L-alanine amidase